MLNIYKIFNQTKRKRYGEATTLFVINKINNKLKFLHRKNRFLTSVPKQFSCNALVQPHFDYACSAWYTKKIIEQNRDYLEEMDTFELLLKKMLNISYKAFEALNWLSVTERSNKCINLLALKYVNNQP